MGRNSILMEVAAAKKSLLEILQPGDKVYAVLRHVSRSGMTRRIDLYAIKNNEHVFLSGYASTLLGWTHSRKGGIVVGGCGMDMGFNLVYALSAALFGHEDNGGYKLKHEWL